MSLQIEVTATNADAISLAVLVATLKPGAAATVTGGGSGSTPAPAPVASYHVLTMAMADPFTPGVYPGTKPGAVVIGTGARQLVIGAESAAGPMVWTNPSFQPFEFDVWMDDENGHHLIAQTMHSTGFGWSDGGGNQQNFVLSGDWGKTITGVTVVPAAAGVGYRDFTTFRATLDGVAMNPPYVAGGSGSANQPAVFTVAPVVPTVVTQSGTPVPMVAADGSINKLIAALPAGATTLNIPAGTYKDVATVPTTITSVVGAGIGKTIIDVTGLALAQGKAALVNNAACSFSQMSILGASCADGNGAAICDNAGGWTVDNVEIGNCQEGLRGNTVGADYTLTNSHIHDCGFNSPNGLAHGVYIDVAAASFTAKNNLVEKISYAHGFKSRAAATTLSGNTVNIGAAGATGPSSCVDVPDGGVLTVTGDHWANIGSDDHNVLTYGLESTARGLQPVSLNNLLVDNPDGNGLLQFPTGTTVNLNGCTYTGTAAPQVVVQGGGGAVNGSFAKAA